MTPSATPVRRPNYWDYIRVEELLALQGGLASDETGLSNDEVLFISVHQVYELWFKLVLRELGVVRDLFRADHVAETALAGAVHGCQRITTILRRCVDHFEVIETLPTAGYLSFRDKLMPASGFQSAQLRQIEILLGLEATDRIPLGAEGDYLAALKDHAGGNSTAFERVQAQLADRPSFLEVFHAWLERTPIDGVALGDEGDVEVLDCFVEAYSAAHGREIDRSHASALERTMGAIDRATLDERYSAEKRALRDFLSPQGEDGPATRRRRAATLFILTYQDLPLLSWPGALVEAVIEMEQALLIFRQRHARMVERVIGRRTGTGGSSGVDYLDQTALRYRIFKDLWAVRTYQIRPEAAPSLERAAFYGFRADSGQSPSATLNG
ncbi:tryptophan 2,3-dioxygenase family protein [Engelhardtia mirabilis]|uniref:Tryptophan 2,3-dioxygenase n=1 Tax=Engelhardtia mirabilis TaxID=2528011 RepID=A0A518BSH4_9BACT|nr:Tryptophan 2,3-dioxygenase [Planctomycetes bacterium Pla133]QDV04247.1 Tryptophan 2,3-dioxygenase [Planctomycetes bacterium Pla86]